MLTCLDVANYFLLLKDYNDLTNLKIQKMVYYAYGLNLALHEDRLFNEKIEAWDYGPVVPELYQAFKKYKDRPVPIPENFSLSNVGNKAKLLDDVYMKYGVYSASNLCDLTHIASTPWDIVYHDESTNYLINDQLISVYFLELLEVLKSNKDINQFKAAEMLSSDEALSETMYVLSHPQDAQKLADALERSAKGETIQFDWRNAG